MVPDEIKIRCFGDTYPAKKPKPRHFQPEIPIEKRPTIVCPIDPPFRNKEDKVRRTRQETSARISQIPDPIPGWPEEPEIWTKSRRPSISKAKYLVRHPKMDSKQRAIAMDTTPVKLTDRSGLDTPRPEFYSNQELVNKNLKGWLYLRL